MKNWFIKHREVLAYLVFGVLTTLLNIVLYALFSRLFGYEAANSWGNVLDNVICILFAYVTNRAFVFASRTQGREALKEFGAFVTCRLGTLVLDAAIMMIFGNLLAAQGAALVESFMGGVLGVLSNLLGPDTVLHMATGGAAPAPSISDGSAAIAIIGGADGPTAIFVTSFYDAQALWGLAVKIFSNVVVVVLNYVFSKLIRGKIEVEDIANAALAGGVCIGSTCSTANPGFAMVIGICAGTLSTLGFSIIAPKVCKLIRGTDTCGVHNLHGMPGLLGGLFGIAITGNVGVQVGAAVATVVVGLVLGRVCGAILGLFGTKEVPYSDEGDFLLEEE